MIPRLSPEQKLLVLKLNTALRQIGLTDPRFATSRSARSGDWQRQPGVLCVLVYTHEVSTYVVKLGDDYISAVVGDLEARTRGHDVNAFAAQLQGLIFGTPYS